MYLIQSSLTLAAFYLFYKLLCSRDTLHRFNRMLLLLILALSAAVPFMHIDLGTMSHEASVVFEELTMTPVEASGVASEASAPSLWQRIPWQLIPWREMLATLYFVGLAVCLVRFAASLLAIVRLIRKSQRQVLPDGIVLILIAHDEPYGPFSWMRYIVASRHDLRDNRDMILAHERAHIRLLHSCDLLFAQLFATAQWFNPAAWLLKRELEAIHEYEADSYTLRQGFDAHQYQLRLFEAATGMKFCTITNNLNNCSTKNRIIMMMKRQTNPWARMKALFVLPVAFAAVTVISCTSPKEKKVENQLSDITVGGDNPLLVFYFEDDTELNFRGNQLNYDSNPNFDYLKACGLTSENINGISALQSEEAKAIFGESGANGAIRFQVKGKTAKDMTSALAEYAQRTGNAAPLKVSLKKPAGIMDEVQVVGYNSAPKAEEQGEIFQVVEEQPMYPGGMEELMKYMQKEIKYPKEAADKGIGGRVIVQFVVNTDGSICEEKVVKSADPSLDAEALRVVRGMPNWTPGKQRGEPVRVRFTLPVAFSAQGGGNTSGTPHTATTVTANESAQAQAASLKTDEEIFQVVEEMPEYPGGMSELMKYFSTNMRYPKEAQDKGIQGRVLVQFVVEKDGSITEAKVVRSVDPQLDAEALRVVNAMPRWTPGKQKGKAVRVRYTLPVMFHLQ